MTRHNDDERKDFDFILATLASCSRGWVICVKNKTKENAKI
jgi:hypothetical protein